MDDKNRGGVLEFCFNEDNAPAPIRQYFMELELGIKNDDTDIITHDTENKYNVYYFEELKYSALFMLLREHYSYFFSILDDIYDNEGIYFDIKILLISLSKDSVPYKTIIFMDFSLEHIFYCTISIEDIGIQYLLDRMTFTENEIKLIAGCSLFLGLYNAYEEYIDEYYPNRVFQKAGEYSSSFLTFLFFYKLIDGAGEKDSIEMYEDKLKNEGTHKHNLERIADDLRSISDEIGFMDITQRYTSNASKEVYASRFFKLLWQSIPEEYFFRTYKECADNVSFLEDFCFDPNILERVLKVNKNETIGNTKLTSLVDANGYLTVYQFRCITTWRNRPNIWFIDKDIAQWFGCDNTHYFNDLEYTVVTGKVKLDKIIVCDIRSVSEKFEYERIIALYDDVKMIEDEALQYSHNVMSDLEKKINSKVL